MKSLFLYVFLFFFLFISVPISAQTNKNSKFFKNEIKAGVGFIGLLQLDEINGERRFKREAFIPVFINYNRDLLKRLTIGAYFGYEYEKVSGTLTDFKGPTHSFVTGLYVDLHVFKHQKQIWIDPYVGVAYYSYSGNNELALDYAPSLRLGINFYPFKKFGICVNTGVGSALIETGLNYKF